MNQYPIFTPDQKDTALSPVHLAEHEDLALKAYYTDCIDEDDNGHCADRTRKNRWIYGRTWTRAPRRAMRGVKPC